MAFRATCVSHEPLDYFLQKSDGKPHLRVSDVVLRINQSPKGVFSHLIRIATNSEWSHSALLYLLNEPSKGYHNTFLVEVLTKAIHIVSWRNEVVPYEKFTVGIKRPRLDWYMETPDERSRYESRDPEDTHGIAYLRHVRGIAFDQLNGSYDHETVFELAALFAERIAKQRLSGIPQIAEAAEGIANLLKHWDDSGPSSYDLRFMCSGLIQYSFFEALRIRIINDLAIPENHEAAIHNLKHMHRIIYREDPDGVMAAYLEQVAAGKFQIADPIPEDVLNLLKTATPADFNNSPDLEWRYIIRKGWVWRIDEDVPADYQPQSEDEAEVLKLMSSDNR
ncbi:MAG: hypothetical protein ACYDER_05400 [Ktedonobacteraceae bacterium]